MNTIETARERLISAIVNLPNNVGEYGVIMLIGYDIANYVAAVREDERNKSKSTNS